MGRPLLINSELKILASFKDYDCVIKKDYKDIFELGEVMNDLINDRDLYLEMCFNSRKLFEEKYSWTEAKIKMENMIKLKV